MMDAHGAGFVPSDRLQALLQSVAAEIPLEHYDLATLSRTLDADGYGIIM